MKKLDLSFQQNTYPGEALTLAIVMTYMAISLVAIVVWKLYTSGEGKISIPGGFKFEWAPTYINRFVPWLS